MSVEISIHYTCEDADISGSFHADNCQHVNFDGVLRARFRLRTFTLLLIATLSVSF
jgi:hypothetical protein